MCARDAAARHRALASPLLKPATPPLTAIPLAAPMSLWPAIVTATAIASFDPARLGVLFFIGERAACAHGCGAKVWPGEAALCCRGGKHILGPAFNPPIDEFYQRIATKPGFSAASRHLNDKLCHPRHLFLAQPGRAGLFRGEGRHVRPLWAVVHRPARPQRGSQRP